MSFIEQNNFIKNYPPAYIITIHGIVRIYAGGIFVWKIFRFTGTFRLVPVGIYT